MTGTPISNAISEMYVWQYLLQFPRLKEMGIDYFDNWASVFGNITQAMEVKPTGSGFRMRTRFSDFVNLPELCNTFGEVTDLVKTKNLGLNLPEVAGGKPELIVCDMSEAQEMQRDEGMERARKIEEKLVKPEEDNMLAICTYMTKVALDGRIIDSEAEDYEGSKLNQCVKRILEIDKENPNTAQVVFCDTNTPKYDGTFTVYEDIKAKLVASGNYKENEIAFVHDAKNDKQRLEMFDKVNKAEIRVIIGSTGKLGTGVNMQQKLIAMHHLDAPYRPSDIEQRNGRGIRQGNTNTEVHVLYYATKGTFDTYRWQMLEKKQETAAKILSGKPISRTCEDIDETALTFAEMKAAATDNPLIAEKLTVDNEIARLQLLQSDYLSQKRKLESCLDEQSNNGFPQRLIKLEKQYQDALLDIETLKENPVVEDNFKIEIGGKIFAEKETAAGAITEAAKNYYFGEKFRNYEPEYIGNYHGFNVGFRRVEGENIQVLLKGKILYKSDYRDSGTGALTRIGNMLSSVSKQDEEVKEAIEKTQKQINDAKELLTRPFEYADKLNELVERQAYINAQLEFGKDTSDEQIVDEEANDEDCEMEITG